MYDFFNTINKAFQELDKPIHNRINNSIANIFIHELQDYLTKLHSSTLLYSLRPYSLLTFAKNDGNFAVCFDYNEKKIYYIPSKKILGPKPEPGEALKVSPNGTFYVDYTAILAEENKIDGYLRECTIAK